MSDDSDLSPKRASKKEEKENEDCLFGPDSPETLRIRKEENERSRREKRKREQEEELKEKEERKRRKLEDDKIINEVCEMLEPYL